MILELYPAGLTCLEMGIDDGPLPVIDRTQGVGTEKLLDLFMAQSILSISAALSPRSATSRRRRPERIRLLMVPSGSLSWAATSR